MNQLTIQTISLILASFVGTADCSPPSKQELMSVLTYVGKRFHVKPDDIDVAKAKEVDRSCFWMLELHARNPDRMLTLYLSPDRLHLTPDLYDITADPLEHEKQERRKTLETLHERQSPELGLHSAPITVVEFSDFQCPYCKQMADTLAQIQNNGTSRDVKLLYRAFPLPIHDWAETAAWAAHCVEDLYPDRFWSFHNDLFSLQGTLSSENIKDQLNALLTREHVPNVLKVERCMNDLSTRVEVQKDIEAGKRLGVNATPTLFINGQKFSGAQSFSQLSLALDRARLEANSSDDDRVKHIRP